MPEGDTLFRAAATMHPVLAGHRVTAFESRMPALAGDGLVGRVIEKVQARGKNLLIHFDDERVLHTHLGLHGGWHLYHPTDRWKRPRFRARVILSIEGAVAVCFDAVVGRLLTASTLERDPMIGGLGPDVLAETFDLAEARARLRNEARRPLGEALLLQRAVAGVGNVYKSELLFLRHLDPLAPVARFTDDELDALLAEARRLMKLNVTPRGGERYGPRTTRGTPGEARLWVYRRRTLPCFVCQTAIEMQRQGVMARSTYYCPKCQPVRT